MKLNQINVLFFCLLSISCSTTKFIPTGMNPNPVKTPGLTTNVFVITKIPENAKIVEEKSICYCSVSGGGIIADYTYKAIEKLKDCARDNGGNAILIKDTDEKSWGASQQKIKAEAIVYYIVLDNNTNQ